MANQRTVNPKTGRTEEWVQLGNVSENFHRPELGVELAGKTMILHGTSRLEPSMMRLQRCYVVVKMEGTEESPDRVFFWYFPLPAEKGEFGRWVGQMMEHMSVGVAEGDSTLWVPVSRGLEAELADGWSDPVQMKIEKGQLVLRMLAKGQIQDMWRVEGDR